ncbi:MAG: YihY/virulence factor BrkB family protein [Acidimicrobiales bacterium]
MDIKARLDALGERWPRLGVALAVQERFGEVGGGPLAGSITLSTFLSIFPLALVGISVVGFLSVNEDDFIDNVLDALGLTGAIAEVFTDAIDAAANSRRTASIVGLLGLLWAGLAVVGSLSFALNSVWQVKGRGLRDRLFGLAWLVGTLVLIFSGLALSGLGALLPGPAWLVAFPIGVLLYTAMFWWLFRVIGNIPVSWRRLLPGAVLAGVGFQVLNTLSGIIVPSLLRGSALYGSIGAVFAIIAWLFIFGRLVVYAAVLNVILFERFHGTVTVEQRVPHYVRQVPLRANRAGAIEETVTADAGRP